MKRHAGAWMMFILILISWSSVGFAAPVGNLAAPAILTSGIVMAERDFGLVVGSMVESANNLKYNEPEGAVREDVSTGVGNTEFRFSGLRAGIITSDWLFVYGFLGQGWMSNRSRMQEQDIRLESDKNVLVGGGVTAVLYSKPMFERSVFRIGVDGKTRAISLGTSIALIDDVKVSGVDYYMSIRDYQAALGVSWQLDNYFPYTTVTNTIVPYAGFKIIRTSGYVRFHYEDKHYNHPVVPSAEEIGEFVGISFTFNKNMSLNLESRFKDEEALSIDILVRF